MDSDSRGEPAGGRVLRSPDRFRRRKEPAAGEGRDVDPFAALALSTLVALVLSAPYPWGAYLPAGTARVQILCFAALALTLVSSERLDLGRPLRAPLGFVLALMALGVVQLSPLPAGLLALVAPLNLQTWHEAGQLASLDALRAPSPRISIAPSETVQALLLVAAYTAAFLATASLATTRLRRRILAGSVVAAALVQIGQALASREGLTRLRGSFVNPNHYAGYLEVGLCLAAGGVWWALRSMRSRAKPSASLERGVFAIVSSVLLLGVIAAGLGFSGSRGAIVGVALTFVWFLPMAAWHRSQEPRPRQAQPQQQPALTERPGAIGKPGPFGRTARSRLKGELPTRPTLLASIAMLAPFLAALLFSASITGRAPVLRFLDSDPRDLGGEGRVQLWAVSRQAFGGYPVFGSGLGTFREAFRRYQPRELSGFVEQAHSEPLQLLVTGGLAGGLLGAGALGAFVAAFLRRFRAQRRREESALVLGALSALFSLLVHGLFEFNFSLPAIPATLAVALGIGWSAGGSRADEDREGREGRDVPSDPSGPRS